MFINLTRQMFTQWLPALFMMALLTAGCQADRIQQTPPQDFQLMAEVDLSDQSYYEAIVGEFTVVVTAVTTIFYTLPNVDTPYFDLSLIGPEEESRVILHSENYRTDKSGGGTWEQNLPPGTYRLALTADPGSGVLSVNLQAKKEGK